MVHQRIHLGANPVERELLCNLLGRAQQREPISTDRLQQQAYRSANQKGQLHEIFVQLPLCVGLF